MVRLENSEYESGEFNLNTQDIIAMLAAHPAIEIISGERTFLYAPYYKTNHTVVYCPHERMGCPDIAMNASVCTYDVKLKPNIAWVDAAAHAGVIYVPHHNGNTYELRLDGGVWKKDLAHPRTGYTLALN